MKAARYKACVELTSLKTVYILVLYRGIDWIEGILSNSGRPMQKDGSI